MRHQLPSFKDWLRTLWIVLATSIWMAGFKHFWTDPDIRGFVFRHPRYLEPFLFLTVVVIPIMGLTYVHWFLWGKENKKLPWWLPSLNCWGEGLWQWSISFIGLTIPFLAIALLADQSSAWGIALTGNPFLIFRFKPDLIETLTVFTLIFWILFMGEAHLARRRLTHWWQNRNKNETPKVKSANKQALPLTVDQELELLKTQIQKKTANDDGSES